MNAEDFHACPRCGEEADCLDCPACGTCLVSYHGETYCPEGCDAEEDSEGEDE